MAKTTKKDLEAEVVIETLELVPVDSEKNALAKFVPFDEQLKALLSEVETMPEITDKASLAHAEGLSKRLRKYEIAVDKTRVASTKTVREMLENLKSHCDGMISTAAEKRKFIDDRINAEQIRLQQQALAEHNRRIQMLESNGWMLNGQFYTCGSNRILFDQVDAADEAQLHQWVELAQQETARIKAEREAEQKRLEEIEKREAALRAAEDEMEEFRAWKAAQAAQIPPPPPVVVEPPVPSFPEPSFAQERAEAVIPPPPPVVEHTEPALAELARLRNSSISHILSQPEAKVHWNMAIDHIHRIFTTSTEQLTKDQWAKVFLNHKR